MGQRLKFKEVQPNTTLILRPSERRNLVWYFYFYKINQINLYKIRVKFMFEMDPAEVGFAAYCTGDIGTAVVSV